MELFLTIFLYFYILIFLCFYVFMFLYFLYLPNSFKKVFANNSKCILILSLHWAQPYNCQKFFRKLILEFRTLQNNSVSIFVNSHQAPSTLLSIWVMWDFYCLSFRPINSAVFIVCSVVAWAALVACHCGMSPIMQQFANFVLLLYRHVVSCFFLACRQAGGCNTS